ncbi:alcohol dehydrogenase catalytic domain-containing protein [Candidatus Woesearchaeota archaeon]|nr:alcohol dehydrogenase catalytic domain-containing protein [Candidatus Woesearchaeota archaeon]
MQTIFAVGLKKEIKGIQSFRIPMPKIEKETDVLIKVKEVGIDGTDVNMVKHDKKDIAPGKDLIVLGHEFWGIVEQVGKKVKTVKPGDCVTMTVRRGCGRCAPCLHNQSDMCMTGLYDEHGIHKTNGFLTEYTVDDERHVIKIPEGIEKYGVLIEPLSIAEKGIEQIKIIQSRMPWSCLHPGHKFDVERWGRCKTALIIGTGPLAFLTTCLFRLAEVDTWVVGHKDESFFAIQLMKKVGAHYIDARKNKPQDVFNICCSAVPLNVIFDAGGPADLVIGMIPFMSRSSIYVMTGIPQGELTTCFDGNTLVRQIVRYNQVIVGSVNSNRNHFEMAIKDIHRINEKFGNVLDNMFTHRFKLSEYEKAFAVHDPKRLKVVVEVR